MKQYLTKANYEDLKANAAAKGITEDKLFELVKGCDYRQACRILAAYQLCQGAN